MAVNIQLSKGMRDSLDLIFSGVLFGGIEKDNPKLLEKQRSIRSRLNRFSRAFKYNVFHDEYAVFFSIIESNNIKLFTESQLKEILDNNTAMITESDIIDLDSLFGGVQKMDLAKDEMVEIFKQYVIKRFREMSNQFVEEEAFESAIEVYRQSYYNLLYFDTIQKIALIMSEGGVFLKDLGKRGRNYQGTQDAQDFYLKKMKILDTLMKEDDSGDLVIDSKWYAQRSAKSSDEEESMVGTGLKEIDDVFSTFNRGHMYTILGPTKGGKTTITAYFVTILLLNGYNVAVWPIEGSPEEWTSMVTASMCFLLENIPVSRTRIFKKSFESEAERQLVQSMELRLASDKRMGTLSFIKGTCYVEELKEKLHYHYKNENKFDCIVVDQLIKVLSLTGKPKVDRIGEGYTIMENFCKNECESRPLALLPSQLKPKVVEAMRKDPTIDIQDTDGAESSEVIRAIDAAIGLFSTDQEKDAGIMKIHCVAARHTAKFRPFRCRCDLGSVAFWSDASLDIGNV